MSVLFLKGEFYHDCKVHTALSVVRPSRFAGIKFEWRAPENDTESTRQVSVTSIRKAQYASRSPVGAEGMTGKEIYYAEKQE